MQCEACGADNVDGARFCAKCGALQAHHEEGPDPLIGQLIGGRYRVTGVLGEGGMGKVYVGEQQMGSTVRKVAIKTLHNHLSKDPSVLARFHRECGTVAQLEHPNTIKFFDFGATNDGTLYIAMEFVAGKPLAEVIRDQGPLSADRVVTIMRQTCGALDEAHLQGIVHRDLKPDNIVLTTRAGETDFVKVLDFGIAARRESADAAKEQKLTQQGMVLGTPPYMSPEQFTGKALDARSDIYSLGVMAYEMLSGKLPFEADTPWQWATQHMTAQPTPFETAVPSLSVPSGMRDAIMKSLSKDREQRQASARDFFAELSGGARMTVTGDPPVTAGQKRSTAAMEAAPDFSAPAPFAMGGAAHAATAHALPAQPPAYVPHMPAAAPAIPAAVPPAPSGTRGGKSGGGKGLLVGLGALGAVLLVAMAVIASRSMGEDEGPTTLDLGTTATATPSTGPAATFGPLVPQPTAEPTPTTTPDTGIAGGAATAKPTATPTAKPTSTATATSGTKPPSGDSCDACISAAQSGSITSAAAKANSCSDAAKKAQCVSAVRNAAPAAAVAAAFNGNCSQAKAIAAAAKAMGAGTAKLDKELGKTSCK